LRIIFFLKRIFYLILCNIYSNLFSSINNFKRKKRVTNKVKFFEYYTHNSIDNLVDQLHLLENDERYQKTFVFDKKALKKLLKFVFTKEFKNYLFQIYGFNYSVDYLFIYKNRTLSSSDKLKSVYANKLHMDKPFSKDMLKIIIPLKTKSDDDGPLVIFEDYKFISKDNNKYKSFLSPLKGSNYYGFNPRNTFHYALPPKFKLSGMHIMMQLNPSEKWKVDKNLLKSQFRIEPNFTDIRNIFSEKENL